MARKFEVITEFLEEGIQLPERSTALSAGYDIRAAKDVVILPIAYNAHVSKHFLDDMMKKMIEHKENGGTAENFDWDSHLLVHQELSDDTLIGCELVPTGIKVQMNEDEVLKIFSRSSLATKKNIQLANSTSIIDADYYNNEKNEGHIYVPLINLGNIPIFIKKGERIAQGIFEKYLVTDNDNATGKREGGLGSTGTN